MVPRSLAFKWNSTPNRPKMPARIPKDKEVTKSARQLATNNWLRCGVVCMSLELKRKFKELNVIFYF
jgi:hypothetical protein